MKCPCSGYFQYVDSASLLALITKTMQCLNFITDQGLPDRKSGDRETLYRQTLRPGSNSTTTFVLGNRENKTAQQDLEFSIHQMVEIAARALSPGVNDPYTAIACIDHLSATMCYSGPGEISVQIPCR